MRSCRDNPLWLSLLRRTGTGACPCEVPLAKELQPWTRTYPFSFYDGIVKLRQWPSIYAIKRPGIIGRYTNDIVYERIEDGLYEELRSRNPVLPSGRRKNKHHQWFTPEYGHPLLKEHIASTSALMRAAPNWKQFYEKCFLGHSPRSANRYLWRWMIRSLRVFVLVEILPLYERFVVLKPVAIPRLLSFA